MIHMKLTDESHPDLRILVAEQESAPQDWVSDLIESHRNKKRGISKT